MFSKLLLPSSFFASSYFYSNISCIRIGSSVEYQVSSTDEDDRESKETLSPSDFNILSLELNDLRTRELDLQTKYQEAQQKILEI